MILMIFIIMGEWHVLPQDYLFDCRLVAPRLAWYMALGTTILWGTKVKGTLKAKQIYDFGTAVKMKYLTTHD